MSALLKMKLGQIKDKQALIRALTLMNKQLTDQHLHQDVAPTGRYIQQALKAAGVTKADLLVAKEGFGGYADLAFHRDAGAVFQAYIDDMDAHKISHAFKCDQSFEKSLEQYYAAACAEHELKQQGYSVEIAYDASEQKVNLQAYAYA